MYFLAGQTNIEKPNDLLEHSSKSKKSNTKTLKL
jgi:hypothetical protein